MEWAKIIYVLVAALIAWFLYRSIRGNKALFAKANITKSLGTLGILALILIAFIAFLVMMVKQ